MDKAALAKLLVPSALAQTLAFIGMMMVSINCTNHQRKQSPLLNASILAIGDLIAAAVFLSFAGPVAAIWCLVGLGVIHGLFIVALKSDQLVRSRRLTLTSHFAGIAFVVGLSAAHALPLIRS